MSKKGRKLGAVAASLSLAISLLPASGVPAVHAEIASNVVISEVYGGGGNSGATWKNDFVELYNPTNQEISLEGWSIQYASAAGSTYQSFKLSGSIKPHSYYLVQLAKGNSGTQDLPAPDAIGSLALGAASGKIALVRNAELISSVNDTDVADFVGYGKTAASSEGGQPTGDLSATTSAERKSDANGITEGKGNGWDTNNNGADFNVVTPNPQNSASPAEKPDGGGTTTPETGILTVAAARTKAGQAVTVEGTVTANNSAIGGGKLSTYIQDATGGINVYSGSAAGFPELQEGDVVRVTGSITEYRGLTEIVPAAQGIEVLRKGQALPAARTMTIADLNDAAKAEALEGQLVKVKGYAQNVPASPTGGGYNVSLVDEAFKGTTLRVMEGSFDIATVQAGVWYEFTAIVSQYNSGYQLIPRKAGDVNKLDPQPAKPSAEGVYSSVVSSVVDGDTVHLTTPVLGTTKVRFLNIDTPETYHNPVTEADKSQKEHGEAAKAYLNSLLKAGDEIMVKVGEEPTDAYGRLLAQIIRKSDGVNVNVEMVEKGYASTYFIWPIGDDYEVFSQAVKKAYDAKLGIWSETNPLMELPFAFRAREQGKGLTRHVGNYYTKTYTTPDKWKDVPVEARVFFNSEAQAQAAGYKSVTDTPAPQENIKLQFLGLNDLHGKLDVTSTYKDVAGSFGKAEYFATYLRQREAANPNTLIMHSGDMIGGSSPVSALFQDEPTVEVMESLGFDVGTVGNHEFDEGTSELLRMIGGGEHPKGTKGYDGMNFPVLAANIEYKDSGKLVMQPYAVKEVNGVKVGFIGVATTQTPSIVIPDGIKDIRFTDEAAAVNKYTAELKQQGVESIVVLAHVPGDQGSNGTITGEIADLANQTDDEVDIIYAAHNHVKLNGTVDGKLIVQARDYGNAFVDVDVEIDPVTKDIVKKSAEIVDVNQANVQPDPEVSAIMKKYQDAVASKLNEVVGENAVAMTKSYPGKGAIGDAGLGNFLADAMKWYMNADFALMNGGGVRDNVDAGPLTWGELFNVQPFGNTLVKVDITGAQFKDILDAMISSYGPDSFVGGARYTWDPATNKVKSLYLANGELVDPNKTYSLVVNNYMHSQTSNKYKLIGQYGKNVVNGPEDIVATVEYAKSFTGPIRYEADGRISTDLAAPVTSAAVSSAAEPQNGWYASDVSVTLSAQDAATAVAKTEYRIDGGAWTSYTGAIGLSASGSHTVEYRSKDQVGNIEATQSLQAKIDKDAPVITVNSEVPSKVFAGTKLALDYAVADELSGVAASSVALNGVPVDGAILLDQPGTHTLTVRAQDQAGNSSVKTFTIAVESIRAAAAAFPGEIKSNKVAKTDYILAAIDIAGFENSSIDTGSLIFDEGIEAVSNASIGKWMSYLKKEGAPDGISTMALVRAISAGMFTNQVLADTNGDGKKELLVLLEADGFGKYVTNNKIQVNMQGKVAGYDFNTTASVTIKK